MFRAPHLNIRPTVAAAVLAAVAYSFIAGHFTTFTRPAEVATFVPGLLALVIAIRRAPSTSVRPDRRGAGWLGWWLLAIGLNGLELAALLLGANHAHPTISDLVNPWIDSTSGRAAGFALWLALGAWLLRR